MTDVIPGLVWTQSSKVNPVAPEEASVVALQQAVQTPDNLPVKPLEDALRRGRGRRTAPAGGRPEPAPWS